MCVGLQYILDSRTKKKVQEDAKSVIVELQQQRSRKEHLLHEEYNTEHEVSAISDELRGKARGEGGEQEIQSGQVIHLLLAEAMGWDNGIAAIPIQAPAFSSQPAHRRRIEVDPQHAAKEPESWDHRAVVPIARKRLHPMCGKPVPSDETGGNDAADKEGEEVCSQTV